MESFENIQETLNAAEASLAKLTIQDKCPRTLQDEMSITHELKRLRLSHNSQPKQIKMALQDYKQYESKAPIRKLKLRRFIVNDPKRQLKRVQTINELEKYVSEYKCNQKVVNDNLTDATENHFKLFKLMHKVKCLQKRTIYVSKSFENLETIYRNDGYCPQMARAFIRAKSIIERLKNRSQIKTLTATSNYNSN